MLDQRLIVGRELALPRLRRFQKSVTRAEGAFIGAQTRPIQRIDLAAQEIEITPARVRSAAYQFDVGISKGDNAAEPEIFAQRPLLDLVDGNLPAQGAI